jgi:hypothetical protein
MQAPPEQMHFSLIFSLDAKLPLKTWIGYFPPPCW